MLIEDMPEPQPAALKTPEITESQLRQAAVDFLARYRQQPDKTHVEVSASTLFAAFNAVRRCVEETGHLPNTDGRFVITSCFMDVQLAQIQTAPFID